MRLIGVSSGSGRKVLGGVEGPAWLDASCVTSLCVMLIDNCNKLA